ncbi:MAG: sugar-binding domain-containing protein [Miniphocaeibacter sp.]|uniref:glycoside hydrolase family 2 protein n=1 Tax=Miniphocaeibacter sp. TaxID=3100973 RepID=UPI0017A17701|nr:glycoside hydrolase family 2 [Gallicola sp.]
MRKEYPRPNFVRKDWLNLNGEWDFKYDDKNTKINVPFVPQCKLSGINERIRTDFVVYERKFNIPSEWNGKNIILHFGAVDYSCEVFLNNSKVGSHKGGNTSFSFDITRFLKDGEQVLTVEVYDPLKDDTIARGKQFWKEESEFIWYTPSTGIWQTVWLEPVDDSHISYVHMTPNIDRGEVEIRFDLDKKCKLPCEVNFQIKFKDEIVNDTLIKCNQLQNKIVIDVFGNRAMEGSFHFTGRYWTPENPVLYDVEIKLLNNNIIKDQVKSYFGMRKVHIENGKFYLNNLPYYNKLILDQGYWKDGLITAPKDEDYKTDIIKFKEMGFNGCRKHEKVEDPRFLYWADKLGFLVWIGMASFWSYTPEAASNFTKEWCDVIKRDYNSPSIVVWGMLNESWGVPKIYDNLFQQAFSQSLYYLAKSLDQSRLAIGNDGWEQTVTDIAALHTYKHGVDKDYKQHELFSRSLKNIDEMHNIVEKLPYAKGFKYNGEPFMITEFGGISMANDNSDDWGYTFARSEEEFISTYERIMDSIYESDIICGYCYTQATDIEQETNGLLDIDHEFKFNPARIKEINDKKKVNNL